MSEVPKYWTKMWITDRKFVGPKRRPVYVGRTIYSCDFIRNTEDRDPWDEELWGKMDTNVFTECIHGGSVEKNIPPDCQSCMIYKKEVLGVVPGNWFQKMIKELKKRKGAYVGATQRYNPKAPQIIKMRRKLNEK